MHVTPSGASWHPILQRRQFLCDARLVTEGHTLVGLCSFVDSSSRLCCVVLMVRDRQRMGEGGKILIASGVDSRLEACKYLSPHDHRGAATISTALFSSPRVNPPKLRNLRNIYITSLHPHSKRVSSSATRTRISPPNTDKSAWATRN